MWMEKAELGFKWTSDSLERCFRVLSHRSRLVVLNLEKTTRVGFWCGSFWPVRNHKSRPNKRTEFFLKRWSLSNEPWSGSAVCGEQCRGGERITSNASYVIILLFQVTSKLTHYFLIYRKISAKNTFLHLLTECAVWTWSYCRSNLD